MSDLTRLPTGALQPFHEAGILGVADVHVAAALTRMTGGGLDNTDDVAVALAVALCVRALRAGSVCVDLSADPSGWVPESEQDEEPVLPWPEAQAWVSAVQNHALVSTDRSDTPLRLVGDRLYLQRYWQDEELIRTAMRRRARLLPVASAGLADGLARLFPSAEPDRQRLAAATAALRQVTIVAGGPGTGKTTTVAAIVALLREVGAVSTVALAAPTGKAAARLQEAVAQAVAGMSQADADRVGDLTASTLHRLLGWRPDALGRFRHDRANPLPQDLVIVDETSMVSLPMMARLLEAVRADARLVLVGDPDQLASIDAGAVLGDLVAAPGAADPTDLTSALSTVCPAQVDAVARAAATGVVVLDHNYRFDGGIAALAASIKAGDPTAVLDVLQGGHNDVEFVGPDEIDGARNDVVQQADRVLTAAWDGDAAAALTALDRHRVLCAHREGPFGVGHWDDLIDQWTQHLLSRPSPGDPWYVGRPLLVTANDYPSGLYNGDTGVVVAEGAEMRAAFARSGGIAVLPVTRLDTVTVTTLRAMTIHRGQGSQFDTVTVVLPPADSPLLTRELLYTAVTRARSKIRVIGSEEAVRAGVERLVRRASGLRGD
ncbi:MAG: exodeoxyribonuclease V subunit alpha [Candidatus Nanopelagicales bacterium]